MSHHVQSSNLLLSTVFLKCYYFSKYKIYFGIIKHAEELSAKVSVKTFLLKNL